MGLATKPNGGGGLDAEMGLATKPDAVRLKTSIFMAPGERREPFLAGCTKPTYRPRTARAGASNQPGLDRISSPKGDTIVSTGSQETASTEVRCWGAELMWDQAGAEMFRKVCRDAFGRDCFCAEGGHCWLTEAALDGLKSRDDVGHTEILADFEAVDPARLQQILECSEQLQEWQRAANRAAKAVAA